MRRLLRRVGIDVVAYKPRNYPHLRRPELIHDLVIDLVVDGGASDGAWASRLRDEGYSGRILSIEPHASSFAELERRAVGDTLWECRRVALGAEPGSVDLNVAGIHQASSTLPMAARQAQLEARSAYIGTEQVERARLDDTVGDVGRVFLKLDVQGAELEALRGATRTLESTQAVEVELSTATLYEGQALVHDVLAYLYDAGFELIGLEPSYRERSTGDLLQANGLLRRR
jgi:FkbM family methyltransferase